MNDAIRKQVRPGWQPVNRAFATVAAGDPNVHVLDIDVSGEPPDNEPNFDAWPCMFRNIHLGSKAFHELTRLIFDGCIPGALGLVAHDLPQRPQTAISPFRRGRLPAQPSPAATSNAPEPTSTDGPRTRPASASRTSRPRAPWTT